MSILLMSSPRRARLVVAAICMTLLMVYLSYQTPSSYHDQITVLPPDLTKADKPSSKLDYENDDSEKHIGGSAPADIIAPPLDNDVEPVLPPSTTTDAPEDEEKQIWPPTTTSESDPTEEAAETESPTPSPTCVGFESWMASKPGPESEGKRKFPFVRPPPECRTFKSLPLEALIERMRGVIKDPDLFRLFENSYPITLDTMVKWRGYANETDEELAYIITGDIDAMWLRDSASQIYSYLPLLSPSNAPDSLASLWRGVINSHSRYINISPYCHSFQPPPESGIPPTHNAAFRHNNPNPSYDPQLVFDCKWELDSLASFLQISTAYYQATGDLAFFGKYSWLSAVKAAVTAAGAMRLGTYDQDGMVLPSAWTFTGWTNRGSETLTNDGLGNPVRENGMVRTAFRPSDDATIFQLLVPANMMWAKYLEEASVIMEQLDHQEAESLANSMRSQAAGIRAGIERDAIVSHREFGEVFTYEVDGFGGTNLMDDANVPSLLAMPLWNYSVTAFPGARYDRGSKDVKEVSFEHDYDAVYRSTRAFVLSDSNPYFAKGPVLSAVGGPHLGPGKAWPMAAIVAGLTAYEPASGLKDPTSEVERQLRMVLESTSGMGVVHETVSSWDEHVWTRPWFGWANGMFGEMILKIEREEEALGLKGKRSLLGRSWQ
ncbi:hypothetical protein GE09DRAFT_1213018 [Coniochaeta sp. 2T2.1]|nr:hypothetical protein GE09DRAFT_1213018 [Coniochaeta sp. 2T2.1]